LQRAAKRVEGSILLRELVKYELMKIPDSLALKIAPAATKNGVGLSPDKNSSNILSLKFESVKEKQYSSDLSYEEAACV
jgi:hypothetical protein